MSAGEKSIESEGEREAVEGEDAAGGAEERRERGRRCDDREDIRTTHAGEERGRDGDEASDSRKGKKLLPEEILVRLLLSKYFTTSVRQSHARGKERRQEVPLRELTSWLLAPLTPSRTPDCEITSAFLSLH